MNNPKLGLTGLLIFGNETFLQTIEGENRIVEELIEKIANDKRHIKFQILSKQSIENRQYSNWAMGFESSLNKLSQMSRNLKTLCCLTSIQSI